MEKKPYVYKGYLFDLVYEWFSLSEKALEEVYQLATDVVIGYEEDRGSCPDVMDKKNKIYIILRQKMFWFAYNKFRDDDYLDTIKSLRLQLDDICWDIVSVRMLGHLQKDPMWNLIKRHKNGPASFFYRLAGKKWEITKNGKVQAGFLRREISKQEISLNQELDRMYDNFGTREVKINGPVDPNDPDSLSWAELIRDNNGVPVEEAMVDEMEQRFADTVLCSPPLEEIDEELILYTVIRNKFGSGNELSPVYLKKTRKHTGILEAYEYIFWFFDEYYSLRYLDGEKFFNPLQRKVMKPENIGMTHKELEAKWEGVTSSQINSARSNVLTRIKNFFDELYKDGYEEKYQEKSLYMIGEDDDDRV